MSNEISYLELGFEYSSVSREIILREENILSKLGGKIDNVTVCDMAYSVFINFCEYG